MMQLISSSEGAGDSWPGCIRVAPPTGHLQPLWTSSARVWIYKIGPESTLPPAHHLSHLDVFFLARWNPTPNCFLPSLSCPPTRTWSSLSWGSRRQGDGDGCRPRLGACSGYPCRTARTVNPGPLSLPNPQNIMPLSAAMFQSERKNPAPQCPPRLEVQMLMPVSWSRMPNHFLHVDTRRAGERLGWAVQCQEPLMMMALHIPEENRSGPCWAQCLPQLQPRDSTWS